MIPNLGEGLTPQPDEPDMFSATGCRPGFFAEHSPVGAQSD